MKTLQELTRTNIWKLKPYSSARDEYKGLLLPYFWTLMIRIIFHTTGNPDPLQCDLKKSWPWIKKSIPNISFWKWQ